MEEKMFNPAQEMSSIAFDKILGGALTAVVEAQNNSSLTTVNFIKNVGFENDQNGNTIKPVYVDFKYPKEVSPYIPARPESYYFTVENGGEGYDQDELNAGAYTVDGKNEIKLVFIVNTEGAITAVNVVEGEAKLTASSKLDITGSGDGASIVLSKNEAVPAVPAVYEDMTLQVPLLTIVPIPFIRVATTDIDMNVKINSIYNTDTSTDTKSTVDTKTNANYGFLFAKGSININASVAHQKKATEKEEVKKEYSLNIKIHAVQVDIDTVQMNEYATRDCLMHIKFKGKGAGFVAHGRRGRQGQGAQIPVAVVAYDKFCRISAAEGKIEGRIRAHIQPEARRGRIRPRRKQFPHCPATICRRTASGYIFGYSRAAAKAHFI